jgi:hypothetical protein
VYRIHLVAVSYNVSHFTLLMNIKTVINFKLMERTSVNPWLILITYNAYQWYKHMLNQLTLHVSMQRVPTMQRVPKKCIHILILLVRAGRSIGLHCVCEECGRPMYRPISFKLYKVLYLKWDMCNKNKQSGANGCTTRPICDIEKNLGVLLHICGE